MRLFVIIHSFNRSTPLLRIEARGEVHPWGEQPSTKSITGLSEHQSL